MGGGSGNWADGDQAWREVICLPCSLPETFFAH
jgi:hypothetical protein